MSAPSSDTAGIRQVIRRLRETEHTLSHVYDGGDESEKVTNESEAVDAITAVDDAYLHVKLPDGERGWVRFVMGNDPEEVVCDYTVNLSPVIDPLTESWWD